MPAPLILDAFSHMSALPMPRTGVPSNGELITMSLTVAAYCKEVISTSQWRFGASSFSTDWPKERGKHTKVNKTWQLCQQAYQSTLRSACKMEGHKQ